MALITAGWTYKFAFTKKFSALNGIYTIAKIYSWAEVLNDNLSLYELLYAPLNIPSEEYNEDIKVYKSENIYKLVSPISGAEVYAPESILDTQPIYPVKEYQNLVLFIPLGIYANPEGLDYIVNNVGDQVTGQLGIDKTPQLTTVGKTYLTEREYDEMEAERKKLASNALNYFTALNQALKENNLLKAQLEGYKKIVEDHLGGD